MVLHTFDLLLAHLLIVSMLKYRLELVENMMQIMHITLCLCARTGGVHLKFGFGFF